MHALAAMGERMRAFNQAEQVVEAKSDFYCIGHYTISLVFANATLRALLSPALRHLAVTWHAAPDLTVQICDGSAMPMDGAWLPKELRALMLAGKAWGTQSEQFAAFFEPTHQIFSWLDKLHNRAIYWVQDPAQLPLNEGSSPLLIILHWWLGEHGRQVVHGAAVGTEAGGLLLVGKGGSGKSTSAFQCLSAGLSYLADDYCLLSTAAPLQIYSLYSSGKVNFGDEHQFPCFQPALSPTKYTNLEKALYFFHPAFSSQIVAQLPLRAVLIPRITGERTTCYRVVSPAAALLAAGPSTAFQLPGARTHTIKQLSQILRQVPSFLLELGTDLEQIPVVITGLIHELREQKTYAVC